MIRLDAALRRLRAALEAAGDAEAALDARRLLEHVTGLGALAQMTEGDRAVDDGTMARLDAVLARRLAGEPVGRITGVRDFYGRTFRLGPDTLEPRPDTECLVDRVLGLVADGAISGVAADGAGLRFADIGTGSGAIAVTLAAELGGAEGVATDIAAGALVIGRENARRHGVDARLAFVPGSYLEPLSGRFGLIVSNPPYIRSGEIADLQREVRLHDPRLALDGGADGLVAYRVLAAGAGDRLVAGGWLVVEIGADQGAEVAGLFAAAGLEAVDVAPDLGGRDRLVIGRLPRHNP